MGFRCPECGAGFDKQVFICPRCLTILSDALLDQEGEAEDSEQPTDVVPMAEVISNHKGGIAIPVAPKSDAHAKPEVEPAPVSVAARAATNARIAIPRPPSPFAAEIGLGEQVTSPALVVLAAESDDARLLLTPGVDLQKFDLTVFEAYVASRVDGVATIAQIRAAVAVDAAKMNAVVASLKGKGILQVVERPPEKKRALRKQTGGEVARSRSVLPPIPVAAIGSVAAVAAPPPPPPLPRRRTNEAIPAAPSPPSAAPAAPAAPADARPMTGDRLAAAAKAGRQKKERSLLQAIGFSKKDDPLVAAVERENAGDIDGAIEYLEGAIAQAREPAPLLNHLALLMVNAKRDFEYAEKLLERAEELDPVNQTYRKNLQKVLILKTKRV